MAVQTGNKLCFWFPKTLVRGPAIPLKPPQERPNVTDDDTPKPKSGRPRKAPDEQRGERLSGIRLTAAERAFVEAQAARAGLSVVEYCRRRILGHRVAPARSATDARAVAELNRIGVNVAMLLRDMNFGRTGLGTDVAETLAELRAALAKLAAGVDDGS